MIDDEGIVLAAVRAMPRWHVIHWGAPGTSTLLCLWVAGRETIVAVDGFFVTYKGRRRPILDGGLTHVLREVEQARDAAALATQPATETKDWLLKQWQAQSPDGVWNFPRGGYVEWAYSGALHVEASDGGPYDHPLPTPLQDVLVDLGWNPPTSTFRNCWLRPGERTEDTAALCVLTPMAAFGYEAPPPV